MQNVTLIKVFKNTGTFKLKVKITERNISSVLFYRHNEKSMRSVAITKMRDYNLEKATVFLIFHQKLFI